MIFWCWSLSCSLAKKFFALAVSRLRLDGDFVLGLSCLVSLSKESTVDLQSIVYSL